MSDVVFTPEFVERGYNNRAAVPDHPHWFAQYAACVGRRAREIRVPSSTCATAPDRRRRSISSCRRGRRAATFVFIHGGYWRALDKSDFSFVAAPLLAQGIAVAVVNYDLCPDVSIATIVDECRRAMVWLAREGAAHGAHGERVVVGGHSAGGHLAAMMFATDWTAHGLARAPFAGGVSLSGVHDLDAAGAVLVQQRLAARRRARRRGCRRSLLRPPVARAAADRRRRRRDVRVPAPVAAPVGRLARATAPRARPARCSSPAQPLQRRRRLRATRTSELDARDARAVLTLAVPNRPAGGLRAAPPHLLTTDQRSFTLLRK